jgi:polyisoprenoid-binding protein YceI
MTPHELSTRLATASPPHLLHVLPPEIFEAARIPGSLNACIYEIAFLSQVETFIPDHTREIVVYGAGTGSLDSRQAAAKLAAAGYAGIDVFEGGLAEWQAAGLPVESSAPLPAPPQPEGRYQVDTNDSVIRWTGRNLFNHHHGTLRLESGEIVIENGQPKLAVFTIDMTSIACEDLTDPAWNAMLIQHLHGDDFFDVPHHPTARFEAISAEPIPGATEGSSSHRIHGNLTLRGITQPLDFPVAIATADDSRLTAQGLIDLDRTAFGSVYGSGKFFRFLGKHVVNDHIHLHVKLHADRIADT